MSDAVQHPAWYNQGRIEVIDAIEDWGLGLWASLIAIEALRSLYVERNAK